MDSTALSDLPETRRTPHTRPRRLLRMTPLAVPLVLVGGLHYVLWALLTDAFAPDDLFSIGLGLYLAWSTLAIPTGLLSLRTRNPRWGAILSWTGLLALGLFSSLFVLTLLRALLLPGLEWFAVPLLDWHEPSAWGVVALARPTNVGVAPRKPA